MKLFLEKRKHELAIFLCSSGILKAWHYRNQREREKNFQKENIEALIIFYANFIHTVT